MHYRRYLHIFLIAGSFVSIAALMNMNSEHLVAHRPPIYMVIAMHSVCFTLNILAVRYWRKIRPNLLRYAILITFNLMACYLVNLSLDFNLEFAFVSRMSLAASIIFSIGDQSELAAYRKRENERLAQEKEKAEQALLRQQLNPHFLFNSLNTLKGFIEEDEASAIKYLHQFAEVYRYVLGSRDKELIPLEEELDLLDSYFSLLQARFGDKLQLNVRVKDEDLSLMVPPLALQLLLENAIKHNEISKAKPLRVEIYTEGQKLIVKNELQEKRSFDDSNGLGLSNLDTRLHFVSQNRLNYGPSADGRFFIVEVPLIKNNG